MQRKKSPGRFRYFLSYISARALRDLHILLFLGFIIEMWRQTPTSWFSTRDIGINYQIAVTVLWLVLLVLHTLVVRLIEQRDQLRRDLEAIQQTDELPLRLQKSLSTLQEKNEMQQSEEYLEVTNDIPARQNHSR